MRLFATSFLIVCKHSGRRLLCLLCVLGVCAALGYAAFSVLPQQEQPKAAVAVVNLDTNPISRMALRSAASMESAEKLLDMQFVTPQQARDGSYAAVITIPEGFIDSILNGENKSPVIELDLSSPLEAMWVRQLLDAAAADLTAAQRGVYTVQESVSYGEGMPARQYDQLVMGINMLFVRAFLDRLSLVQEQTLSASGALSLPLYYLAAAVSVLFFCYGFLFQPAIQDLRRFARAAHARGLFAAAGLHVFLLMLMAELPIFLFACWLDGFAAGKLPVYIGFAFIASAFAAALSTFFSQWKMCAGACLLLSVGTGLCAGCFLPLALMPEVFSRIAPFTPAGQGLRLCAALFGEQLSAAQLWQPWAMGVLLYLAAAVFWRRGEVAER